jgi:hypothetical protein
MPNSKSTGTVDVGAAACQSSHPSLCPCVSIKNLRLRRVALRIVRSEKSVERSSGRGRPRPRYDQLFVLLVAIPRPAKPPRPRPNSEFPSWPQKGAKIFRVFRSKNLRLRRVALRIVRSEKSVERSSGRGRPRPRYDPLFVLLVAIPRPAKPPRPRPNSEFPSWPQKYHKKAQRFSVCFAVEKTARPAKFLFISFLPETRRHGGVQGGAWQ